MIPKMQRAFGIVFCILALCTGQLLAQQLTYAEYYLNNDPGRGNATSISISPGDQSDISVSIPTTSLSSGMHTLYIRYRDAGGKWTLSEGRRVFVMNTTGLPSDNIIAGEYFFNNDPGRGAAVPLSFSAGTNLDFTQSLATAALPTGLNHLFVRFKNANGHWSIAEGKPLYIIRNAGGIANLTAAEYFFNSDPGIGNGIPLTFTPEAAIDLQQAVNITGLTSGLHQFSVRVKNAAGIWSIAEKRTFYIIKAAAGQSLVQAEYFFNNDPGAGNAIPISITAAQEINITEIIPTSSVPSGINKLSVRIKDGSGMWSLAETRTVMVQRSGAQVQIVALEYFIDSDPGVGQASRVNLTAADTINHLFSFAHSIPDTFGHRLYSRVLDAAGNWSSAEVTPFRLEDCIIPVADFTVQNICDGEQIVLRNTSLQTDTGTAYKWDVYNNGAIDYTASDSIVLSFPAPGTYEVKLMVNNFVCYDSVIKTIVVHPLPQALISTYGNTSFCQGGSVVLSANTGIGYQYQWYRNDTIISLATGSFLQASVVGDYKVMVENIHGCQTLSAAVTANVLPLPDVTVTPSGSLTFCDGESVQLQAVTVAGSTYQWIRNGNAIAGATQSSYTAGLPGNYSVFITNSNNCFSTSPDLGVTVNPLPQATLAAGGPTTICQGENLVLYAGNGPGYSFEWLRDGGTFSGATGSFLGITQGGAYRVVVTNAFLCKDTSSSIPTLIHPLPPAQLQLTGSNTICFGDSVKLEALNTTGLSFQWKNNGVVMSGITDSVMYVKQGGNYSLLTTNSFNCSNESSSQTIIVNPLPGAGIIPAGSTTFCEGDSVSLFAPTGTGLSYQWHRNSLPLSGETANLFVAKTTGFYSVVVMNSYNCSLTSPALSVTAYAVPTATFSLPQQACLSDTLTLSYTGSGSSSAVYNWNLGEAMVVSGNGQGPLLLRWPNGGNKTITLSVFENACTSVPHSQSILIKSVPASISAPVTSVCQGDSIVLTANTGASITYQWLSGGIPLPGMTQPYMSAYTSGFYSVDVTDTVLACTQRSQSVNVNVFTTNFNLAFNAVPSSFTQPPFTTYFNNTTPNMNNYNFLWEFGDGNTSTLFQPYHQYQFNGNYTVKLYAENVLTGCRDTLVKTNYISCTGGVPNPCNIVAAITPAGPATICFNDSILLSASVGAGYSYQWTRNGIIIAGAASQTLWAKQNGTYRVIITNPICSQNSPPFVLNHYPSIIPNIMVNGSIQPCTDDSLQLYLPNFYTSYSWSTGHNTPTVYIKQTGYYSVIVTDNYGCTLPSQPLAVNASFLTPPDICIVTVDTNNHNLIVWERPPTQLIDSFYLYREGIIGGQYEKIAALPYSAHGLFSDTASNPQVRAYRYKLAAVDTCGGVTLLSDFHKSIHLTINAGLNGTWNLIWDGYVGFPFWSYAIYRGTTPANMTLLTQLPATLNSYTDLNPPTGTLFYMIEVIKTSGCYPDSVFSKAMNYNSSRSNQASSGNIAPIFLTADFSAATVSGVWPMQIEFADLSSGFPAAWRWYFGDGNTSVEQNPRHTYNNTGLYTVSLVVYNSGLQDSVAKVDYINILPNGMAEIQNGFGLNLYPNPNSGSFTVEFVSKESGQYSLELYNMLGERMYSESFHASRGIHRQGVEIAHLPRGVYFLIAVGENGRMVKKMLVR